MEQLHAAGFAQFAEQKESMPEIVYDREIVLAMMFGKLIHTDPALAVGYTDADFAEAQKQYVQRFAKNSYWNISQGSDFIDSAVDCIVTETDERWEVYTKNWLEDLPVRESAGYVDVTEAYFSPQRLRRDLKASIQNLNGHTASQGAAALTKTLQELTYVQLGAELRYLKDMVNADELAVITGQREF